MPTVKLGQAPSNALSDVQQRHWDADMKIREHLSIMSLDEKMKLIVRLPGVIAEIRAELRPDENRDFVTG